MKQPEDAPARESTQNKVANVTLSELKVGKDAQYVWRRVAGTPQQLQYYFPEAAELITEFESNTNGRYSNGAKALMAMLLLAIFTAEHKEHVKQQKTDDKFAEIMAKVAENGEKGES